MLRNGQQIFLWIPEESKQRILHPGKVVELDGDNFVCEFEEDIAPAVGSSINIFMEVKEKFVQQSATVSLIRQGDTKPVIAFQKVGEPLSAESRSTYRVSTVMTGIQAAIAPDKRCPIVDVSPEGFGAITQTEHAPGTLVNVSMVHEGKTLQGQARVQTVKKRPDGKTRCGFFVMEKKMRTSLERMYADAQRAQLRRLAGGA